MSKILNELKIRLIVKGDGKMRTDITYKSTLIRLERKATGQARRKEKLLLETNFKIMQISG